MKSLFLKGVLLIGSAAALFAQASNPLDLSALERKVFEQYNQERFKALFPKLKLRKDKRMRMEACSVQIKGPDGKVEDRSEKIKFWYVTTDLNKTSDELVQLARVGTNFKYVGVGVWFAKTEIYPDGAYWVVVFPENSAGHEAFWGHFYLTDDFEYVTLFDRYWKKQLPKDCRSIG